MKRFAALLLTLILLVTGGSGHADTVRLKNGRVYHNVKSVQQSEGLLLIFENGRTLLVKPGLVAGMEVRPVVWNRPAPSNVEKLIETRVEERLKRIREETKGNSADARESSGESPQAPAAKEGSAAESKQPERAKPGTQIIAPAQEPDPETRLLPAVLLGERRPYVMRSLAFPGWGQLHEGKTLEGGLLIGGAVALLWTKLGADQQWRTARADFDRALAIAPLAALDANLALPVAVLSRAQGTAAAREMDASTARGNNSLLLLAGLYAFNVYRAARPTAPGIADPITLLPVTVSFGTVQNTRMSFSIAFRWSI